MLQYTQIKGAHLISSGKYNPPIPSQSIYLKVFAEGFGEVLFSKSISPSNPNKTTSSQSIL